MVNRSFHPKKTPYHDAEIKNAADNINRISITLNGHVKVLVNQEDRKVFKEINDLKQLEVAKTRTVFKQQHIRGSNEF